MAATMWMDQMLIAPRQAPECSRTIARARIPTPRTTPTRFLHAQPTAPMKSFSVREVLSYFEKENKNEKNVGAPSTDVNASLFRLLLITVIYDGVFGLRSSFREVDFKVQSWLYRRYIVEFMQIVLQPTPLSRLERLVWVLFLG